MTRAGRKKANPKPLFAWALVDSRSEFHLEDHRLPIYWLRRVAERHRHEGYELHIVRVLVVAAPRRRKERKHGR